jgi:hypothetical protein
MSLRKIALLLLLILVIAGCARGPRIVPVSGTITLDGQPVKDAAVMFMLNPDNRIATGITDAAGRYSLSTHPAGNGAFEGTHTVTVSLYRDESSPGTNTPEGAVSGSSLVKIVWLVPEKYSQPAASGLTATVSRSQSTYDFQLSAQ